MPRSTVNPAPVTVRKAVRENGRDWLFVYLRVNAFEVEAEGADGESHTEYEYDEVELCVPLPDTGINMWAAEHHARNQDMLKRALRLALAEDDDLRWAFGNAVRRAGIVDRVDRIVKYTGPVPVDVEQARNWAEAMCIILAPQDVSGIQTEIVGEYKRLIDIGDYRLWSANAPVDTLRDLHAELWATQPAKTLGVLAVVKEMGESFMPWAVTDATDTTVQEMAARRDRISAYLQGLGHDTGLLDEAENEHGLMAGIVDALGYEMKQLWEAM